MFDGASPLQHGGLGLGIEPRRAPDVVRLHPCNGFGPLGRIPLDPFGEPAEAVGPLLDELLVVELLADDHVEHGEPQRIVGAGAKLEKVVGALGEHGLARVDDDDLGLAGQGILYPESQFAIGPGIDGVVAPEQDQVRLRLVGIGADGQLAHGDDRSVNPGPEALSGAWLAPVGGADGVGEAGDIAEVVASGPGAHPDALGAVALGGLANLGAHLVVGLVPGDALPLPLAPSAGPAHGIFEPGRVVDLLQAGRSQGTQLAPVHRVVGIAVDVDQLAVFDVHDGAAAPMTHSAGRFVPAIGQRGAAVVKGRIDQGFRGDCVHADNLPRYSEVSIYGIFE